MKRKSTSVVQAEYLDGFRLKIHFSDGNNRIVDFAEAFASLRGYYSRFNSVGAFKKFKMAHGNISWGPDEAVIFQIAHLYSGKLPKPNLELVV